VSVAMPHKGATKSMWFKRHRAKNVSNVSVGSKDSLIWDNTHKKKSIACRTPPGRRGFLKNHVRGVPGGT